MVDCDEDKVLLTMKHVDYPDVECFTGLHLMHTMFAIVAAMLFLCIVIIVSLCYYECKCNPNVPTAMTHGSGNFLLVVYNIVMIVCVTIMANQRYHYLICIIQFGGA
jgi:hypothetical protein